MRVRMLRNDGRTARPPRTAANGAAARRGGPVLDRASTATVTRLSSYYRSLAEWERAGVETVSSRRLAESCGVTPAQVRKDLSFFGSFGRRGLGYNVERLRAAVRDILGLSNRWRVALVGAGNLGHALFAYRGFRAEGFEIEQVFDSDPAKVGTLWNAVRIAPLAELPQQAADPGIDVVIVAVPQEAAQAVADLAVQAGVPAILNFAPVTLSVPAHVALRQVDLAVAMESLSYVLANR
jgi:redox-sensing transcriptional repressor